jgi:sucrose synthase
MPGLYRVVAGIDVYDPKFNIVSPGADEEVYFPNRDGPAAHTCTRRSRSLVFGDEGPGARGPLADPDKPLLFTMARLDRIKNITGSWTGSAATPALRERPNLLVVGGSCRPERSATPTSATRSSGCTS